MIHRLVQFLAFLTLVLLFLGGLVTSTDSGLAVPDWPLSFGSLTPPMVGGIRFEHTHRLVAATVGFLTLILTFWIGFTENRPAIRRLSIAALGAVVLQGILGGLTVIYKLPAPVSIAHACLGPSFFALVVCLAEVTAPDQGKEPSLRGQPPQAAGRSPDAIGDTGVRASSAKKPSGLAMTTWVTPALIFLQILLGALVRHTGEGISFHIASAFLVLFFTGAVVRQAFSRFPSEPRIQRPALFLAFLVILEFFLGIGAFVFTRIEGMGTGLVRALFPTLHQTLGSLILATSVILILRSAKVGARFIAPSAAIPPEADPPSAENGAPAVGAFFALTKPRLVFLVLWSVTIGFVLGSRSPFDFLLLVKTLGGAGLVAAGSMALNQYLERESDARMKRTEGRPLPSGRMKPSAALLIGTILSLAGLSVLALGVNRLSAALALAVLVSYLWIYTPLKKKTFLSTLAGAVPGAIPPMMGWAAARGELGLGAWILFAILFAWQLPHFLAIAWVYREDYARAGFPVLSVVDPTGKRLGRQIMLTTLAVYLLSFLPPLFGMTGNFYYLGALLLGIWLIASSFRTAFALDRLSRSFFRNSVIYLSLLFLLLVLDRRPL